MRIIIESTEQASTTAPIYASPIDIETTDGGAPAEALIHTITESAPASMIGEGINGGAPPEWLIEAIQGAVQPEVSSLDTNAGAGPGSEG